MHLNSHYLIISSVVIIFIAIFGFMIRSNKSQKQEDIMPTSNSTEDVLLSEDDKGYIEEPEIIYQEEYVGKARVLSEEEAQRKFEEMERKATYSQRTSHLTSVTKSAVVEAKSGNEAAQDTIIVIYVMAKAGESFSGSELHQSLVSAGLISGPMKIFHRYAECSSQTQQILFSVASAVNPGHIDANNLMHFSTRGLTLFMDYSKGKNISTVFQMMLNTAKLLAQDLNGDLLDMNRQPWSLSVENECRRRLQHFNMQMAKNVLINN